MKSTALENEVLKQEQKHDDGSALYHGRGMADGEQWSELDILVLLVTSGGGRRKEREGPDIWPEQGGTCFHIGEYTIASDGFVAGAVALGCLRSSADYLLFDFGQVFNFFFFNFLTFTFKKNYYLYRILSVCGPA